MKSSSQAPDPDPKIGEAALKQAETGEAWLSFAKDAFSMSQERQAELDTLTKQISEQQLGLATMQAKGAKDDRQRYEEVFRPIEDEFINEAKNYATEARQNEAAATARADVQTAMSGQRAAAERQASSMGINPASGRFASIQAGTATMGARAEAVAANTARRAVRDMGLALKADVANMGRGSAAMAASGAAGSVSSSGTALAGNQATNGQFLASTQTMNAGFGGAMQGYAGMGDTLNRQYGLQLEGWKAEQEMAAKSMAGIGSFMGGIAGLLSDENVKENKEPIADGEGLEAVNSMPIDEWDYKKGHGDEGHHVGTYAKDFQRATGKGDGKMIPIVDAIGITMKAIQDLDVKIDNIGVQVGLGAEPRAHKPANDRQSAKKKEKRA